MLAGVRRNVRMLTGVRRMDWRGGPGKTRWGSRGCGILPVALTGSGPVTGAGSLIGGFYCFGIHI